MGTPYVDLRAKELGRANPALKSSQTVSAANYAIFQTRATMETYLLGQGFNQAYLDSLTDNDIVFQCRQRIGAAVNASP
jgi:hypothetical protein